MKRISLIIAAYCLMLGIGFAQETFTAGDLNYRVNNDGVSVTVI